MLAALLLAASVEAFVLGSENSTTLPSVALIDEDTTIPGDLILDGARSLRVENCSLEIGGRVIVSGGSRLLLRNVNVRLAEMGQADPGASMYRFHVRGSSTLEAVNVTIETAHVQSFGIRVSDSAELWFRGVHSMDWGGLTCDGGSSVAVEDSTCWSMFHVGGLSALRVSDSRIFGVNVTGGAEALMEGVHANSASASGGGSLLIRNSTMGSDTWGLELGFGEGTRLTLSSFPASPTGIDFWHCDRWSLLGENDVTASELNVTLIDVYFRHVRLNVGEGADVRVVNLDAPVEIACSGDSLEVASSSIEGVRLKGGCALSAESIALSWLEAFMDSSATLRGSTVQRTEARDSSVISYSSSRVGSLSCGEKAVIVLCDSTLPEQLNVGGDSAVVHSPHPTSVTLLGYTDEGALELGLDSIPADGAELTVVVNRYRVRQATGLDALLDGEPVSYGRLDEKELSRFSFQLLPGARRLIVALGPPPSERVPFLQTLLGQRLVTLLLVLLLVLFVLLNWR
jgi:hypothetical protein